MVCYECARKGVRREAVALCHHCSAALCLNHVVAAARPVTAREPIERTVVLPLEARELLCGVCHAARQQTSGGAPALETAPAVDSPGEPAVRC